MSHAETAEWLAALQARFGAALRTPLEPSGGKLSAALNRYPLEACADLRGGPKLAAAERLAVYNRQYWMRLLRLLQNELPLTSRLLGAWFFNQHATRFLLAHPPQGHDLARVADGFAAFLERDVRSDDVARGPRIPALPRAALLTAAELDAAFRRVFFAREQPRYEPAQGDARELATARLRLSAACAWIEERWPLLRLRSRLLGAAGDRELPVALPDAWPQPQHWLLLRSERGVRHVSLEPLHARLLALLETQTVAAALGQLEAECPPARRDALPAQAQRWLMQDVAAGVFTGLTDGDTGP